MHALCITALSPNKYLALEVRNRARHASVAGRAACAPARSCNRMTTPMRNVLANLSCGCIHCENVSEPHSNAIGKLFFCTSNFTHF